jgi:hypothetical protein
MAVITITGAVPEEAAQAVLLQAAAVPVHLQKGDALTNLAAALTNHATGQMNQEAVPEITAAAVPEEADTEEEVRIPAAVQEAAVQTDSLTSRKQIEPVTNSPGSICSY